MLDEIPPCGIFRVRAGFPEHCCASNVLDQQCIDTGLLAADIYTKGFTDKQKWQNLRCLINVLSSNHDIPENACLLHLRSLVGAAKIGDRFELPPAIATRSLGTGWLGLFAHFPLTRFAALPSE